MRHRVSSVVAWTHSQAFYYRLLADALWFLTRRDLFALREIATARLLLTGRQAVSQFALRARRGPGWLSHDIANAMEGTQRVTPIPPPSLRIAITAPNPQTLASLGLLFLALVGIAPVLALGDVTVPRLPATDLISVFTSMWQVQAGIAALALPVLIFVVERSRDQRQAALHTAEVLGRESWSLPIIGFAFVVVGRMGIDLVLFSDEQLVFLSDVFLFLVTLSATVIAYYRVLRILLSPSRLRERSIALAREKTRPVLIRSAKVRIGNNLLFRRLETFGVQYWPFGVGPRDTGHVILDAPRAGYLQNVHLEEFERFVARLPWLVHPATSGIAPQPSQVSSLPETSRADAIFMLRRFGDPLSVESLGLLRLRRASFHHLSEFDRLALESASMSR